MYIIIYIHYIYMYIIIYIHYIYIYVYNYIYNYTVIIYILYIYILQCLLKSPTSSWRNVPRPEESTSEAQQLAAYSGWESRPWRFLSSRCSFRIRSILPGALRYADLCRLRQTACHEYHKRGNAARNDAGHFHVGLQSSYSWTSWSWKLTSFFSAVCAAGQTIAFKCSITCSVQVQEKIL